MLPPQEAAPGAPGEVPGELVPPDVSIDAPAAVAAEAAAAFVEHPVGILAVLLCVLALIFKFAATSPGARLYRIVPQLVFCYFVPTALTTAGVIPPESPLYGWVKTYLLPCSLLLLILALDVPGIARLGPRAVIMLLAGTLGVVVGGPLAFFLGDLLLSGAWALPEDSWRGLSALAGSWIGGGANFVAIGEAAEVTDEMLGLMVIVDVFAASLWMGALLWMSGQQERIDRWTGADTSTIDDLKRRIQDFQARVTRVPTLTDLLVLLALGFLGAWLAYAGGNRLATWIVDSAGEPIFDGSTWKFILVTAAGVVLSYTRARDLEGAGASRLGSVMIYLLVACIGASASFSKITEAPGLIVVGLIWISCHAATMLIVGKLIRAPIFFVAVGSQSNIGGAASAPVVASAFHPALAPVGALLAVAGYVLGTYAGLLTMWLLKQVAGVE